MDSKEVYVIMNDSYGEVIAVTDNEDVKDRIMREELERYGCDEEWIKEVLSGNETDETIICRTSQWIGK